MTDQPLNLVLPDNPVGIEVVVPFADKTQIGVICLGDCFVLRIRDAHSQITHVGAVRLHTAPYLTEFLIELAKEMEPIPAGRSLQIHDTSIFSDNTMIFIWYNEMGDLLIFEERSYKDGFEPLEGRDGITFTGIIPARYAHHMGVLLLSLYQKVTGGLMSQGGSPVLQ